MLDEYEISTKSKIWEITEKAPQKLYFGCRRLIEHIESKLNPVVYFSLQAVFQVLQYAYTFCKVPVKQGQEYESGQGRF